MSLADDLRAAGVTDEMSPGRRKAVWSGPNGTNSQGGITFSLLCKFLVCRERFRCLVIDGLKAREGFNHRLEYGNMWHLCEEVYGKNGDWLAALTTYAKELCRKYTISQEDIDKWYRVCKAQFPEYLKFWENRKVKDRRITLMSEVSFDVPYTLPSGRQVRLRGKWDQIFLDKEGVKLQENKTKGDIDERAIGTQLKFDLQTMMYLIALDADKDEIGNVLNNQELWYDGWDIRGVVYNVVRRPLSGGRHTIVQHKPTKSNPQGESKEAYYERLQGLIASEPDFFFMRWNVGITQEDIKRFRKECLDPILENLCHWWDHQSGACDPTEATHGLPPSNWRFPYGIYNPLTDGGGTELDNYLINGDMTGLQRTTNLFPELT